MNFNVTESEGPRILWQIDYSVSESCSSFLPQCSQRSCVSLVPPLAFQVCTEQQEIMWKKIAIFLLATQRVGGKGFFLQVKSLFFPKVKGNAKIYHPMQLHVFSIFSIASALGSHYLF